MATSTKSRRERLRDGMTIALVAGFLTAMSAAHADTRDLYTALRDGDCTAVGDAVNRGLASNDPESYFFAGYLYDATGCVADDPARAARFYRRSAELGFADARIALGRLYGLGRGVAQDYAMACRWYTAGPNGEPAPTRMDPEEARLCGYAITVAQVARGKVRYPMSAERSSLEATLDAVFEPSTGRVTIGNAKASIEVGSNVGKTGPFRDAVETAYADAVATLDRPDAVATSSLRFSTPWRFGMRRNRLNDRQQPEGAITLGDTVVLPSAR